MTIGLEKYLICPVNWDDDISWRGIIPRQYVEELDSAAPGRQPIGLGRHPKGGWFVMCSGQGPFVAWSEWGHSGSPYYLENGLSGGTK